MLGMWERGEIVPDPIQLARWGAVVGLDISIRAYAGGSPLRDAGQLRLLRRARAVIGDAWRWDTEAPVTDDPLERRAFDAILSRGEFRIGLEAISRLMDAQAQVRAATLKQEASGVDRMVLVLADTRHNRDALRAGAPTLAPAFPLAPRGVLATLRSGRLPGANGVMLV